MNRDADNRGVDLVNTPGYAFQCKRLKAKYPNLEETIYKMDTEDEKIVIHKRDRKDVLATMTLDTLIKLINNARS